MAQQHGILVPSAGNDPFTLARHPPADDLTEVVDRFWIVRWDLRDKPPFEQETLPYPCVHMVFGTHRPGVHGPLTSRFVARLEGEGWVLGAKFRPAGFRGLTGLAPTELVDRELTLVDAFAEPGRSLDGAVLGAADDRARIAEIERFIRGHHRGMDDDGREANRIVELARADAAVARVTDLAARAERPVRAIERIFRTHVGVPPKWVIQRFRVQEAAARLASGKAIDWRALALDLGYFDQAHFIRDFKSQIGRTPAQYAKMCAAPMPPLTRP